MTEQKSEIVAIIGASPDRHKYGNRALRGFAAAGYTVWPVNPNYEEIEGHKCSPSLDKLPGKPDIISIYTPPPITVKLMPAIARVGAAEVYFNPGSENEQVQQLAAELGVNAIFACSVVARAFFTD